MSESSGVMIGLFLGVILGAGALYMVWSPTVNDYNRVSETLETQTGSLQSVTNQLDELIEAKDDLESDYSSLQRDNRNLESRNFVKLWGINWFCSYLLVVLSIQF